MFRVLLHPALLALVLAFPAVADEEPDLELGEEIYDTCAPCHGPFGQGGGGGVYPRMAGMPAEFIAEQLRRFKDRERENIPMIPYANERELPEEDVIAVAAYLEQIELQTQLPQTDEVIDGLERLNQAKRVLNIPLAEGDTQKGGSIFQESCATCHGKDGYGTDKGPLLAGQHIRYLSKQIEDFIEGTRWHRNPWTLFRERKPEEFQNLYAYLSTLDDSFADDESAERTSD